MSKQTKQSTKKVTTKQAKAPTLAPRRLKRPKKVWYNPLTWFKHVLRPPRPKVTKARYILVESIRLLNIVRRPAVGITIVYALSVFAFVRGLSVGQDISSIKQTLDALFTGTGGHLQSLLVEFLVLFNGSSTTTSVNGSFFQAFLLIICSLAIIWAFRQARSDPKPTTKAAFYTGMYPLVQFMITIVQIGLRAIPLLVGSYLYRVLITNGVAVHGWEIAASLVVVAVLAYWSLRMLIPAVFALYIVSLPGMTPLRALRSATELIAGRRWLVVRKFLLLPVVLLLTSVIIVLPFLLFWPQAAAWVFYILSTLWFVVGQAYLYVLYKELIKDE